MPTPPCPKCGALRPRPACVLCGADLAAAAEPTDGRVDQLLGALDAAAREVDRYEYGLPLYRRPDPLRQIVRDWLAGA
jgi:hypothetical protein